MLNSNCYDSGDLEQIILNIEEYENKFMADASSFQFLDSTSSEAVLTQATRQGILSNSSHETIISLQKQESEKFESAVEATISEPALKHFSSISSPPRNLIRPGQVGYFMNRFLLDLKKSNTDEVVAEVRCMVENDWMYLHELTKMTTREESSPVKEEASDYAKSSAIRALASLKSIPAAARRALPVLVDGEGVVLSIPVCNVLS